MPNRLDQLAELEHKFMVARMFGGATQCAGVAAGTGIFGKAGGNSRGDKDLRRYEQGSWCISALLNILTNVIASTALQT